MVQRGAVHQNVTTWAAIFAVAVTLAAAAVTVGDAKQQLVGDAAELARTDGRVTKLETDMSDMKISLARIEQYSKDARDTTHRLERGHVYSRVDD